MNNANVDLHYTRKKVIFLVLMNGLLTFAAILLSIVPANDSLTQLFSLLHSKYHYSAFMQQTVLSNDYCVFNAGIEFSLARNSQTSINADIVMQTAESEYTDSVYWNAKRLGDTEIAITQNLASRNHLHVGDSLFSKNVIDGLIYEYSITQIVPETSNIRTLQGTSLKNGIIIMGYQKAYVDNISHEYVAYTNSLLDEMAHSFVEMPRSPLYRDDEIRYTATAIIPYIILLVVLYSALILIQAIFINREVRVNYKRLLALGADLKRLNKSHSKLLCFTSLGSGVIAIILSLTVGFLIGINRLFLIILLFILVVHMVVLYSYVSYSEKKMWRN